MNNVIDCPYFVIIHYIDKEDNYYEPAKVCSSPYKCTKPCVENSDLRYRVEEKQES